MKNLQAVFLLLVVASAKGEFNCCNQIEISSSGLAGDHQGNRLGIYNLYDVQDERPIYKQEGKQEFLFYLVSNKKGLWMVGPQVGQFNGGLAHRGDNICVQNVKPEQWKYTDGAAWHRDPKMNISCVHQVVDCLYKDGWDLEGSDLPSSLGGGGLETTSSAQCIQQCQARQSCHYWTFVKNNTTNCFLKKSNGKLVERQGYLSGSIPAACSTTNHRRIQPTSQESTSELGDKGYNDKEINGKFKITSLKWNNKLNDKNSKNFRDLAASIEDSLMDMLEREQELKEKLNFTVSVEKFKKGSVVCNFKVNYVLREAYVAIPFVIKPSNITNTLMKNFRFKKGILFQRFLIAAGSFNASSPVDHCASKGCSHKCNYDYDIEDYICTCPKSLALNINQLTCVPKDQQNKNLEQTETTTITTDSQEDSNDDSGLDTKEKDDEEDIAIEVVTSSANEVNTEENAVEDTTKLNDEDAEKVTENNEEEITEISSEESKELDAETSPTPIVLTLLPTDCLWSPWSVWAACSVTCGEGQTFRTRDVLMEQRNGGSCPGESRETFQCQHQKCTESDNENIITQELDEEIITQELDENNVTPSINDDNNFADDGAIQFGEKLPNESTEGDHMKDLDSTTINIHLKYDTTTPGSEIEQEEKFRKDDDELMTFDESHIFDPLETTTTGDITTENIAHAVHNTENDHDTNDNDLRENEETSTTVDIVLETVTHGIEETTSDIDDISNQLNNDSDSTNEDPENVINITEESTGFPDDDRNDEKNFVSTTTSINVEDEITTINSIDIVRKNDDENQNLNNTDENTDSKDNTVHFPENEEVTTSNNDKKLKEDEETTTAAFLEEKDNTVHFPENEEETTSNNNDTKLKEDEETTTSAILEDDNKIITKSNNDYEDEDNQDQTPQQSETTQPSIDAFVVTVENNPQDEVEISTIKSVSTNDIHFDSTDFPILNQIIGISNNNESQTVNIKLDNMDTTEAIPISDILVNKDYPTTIASNQGLPVTSESSQDNPITSESSQDNPVTSDSNQDNPVTSESSEDYPVTTESSQDSPVTSESSQDNPVTSEESSQDSPVTSESSLDSPVTSESSQDYPVTTESSQDSPVTSESSQDSPVTSESNEDNPVTSESSEDSPVTSESSQDFPITSESSQDYPELNKDYPNTSESSQNEPSTDYPNTSETSQDSLIPSEPKEDNLTSEENQDHPTTSEASQNESSTDYPNTSETSQNSLIPSEPKEDNLITSETSTNYPITSKTSPNSLIPSESKEDNLTTEEASQNNSITSESSQEKSSTDDPLTSESRENTQIPSESNKDSPVIISSTTKESGFTTILIPKEQITTTPAYEGSTDDQEVDITEEEQMEITTIQAYFEGEEDITTTARTVIEETTTIPNDGHFKFKCSEMGSVDFDIAKNQLPMNCTLENGNEEEKNKHVIIIINKDSFDFTRLFDDNIKLVAKNVMLMDMSKR